MQALTKQQIQEQLQAQAYDGWQLKTNQEGIFFLEKVFEFTTYMQGPHFAQEVALIAEKLDHHPEILIKYKLVQISIFSHDANGLTNKDFAFISELAQIS
ncbi:MAG TPA: 4a-hydroxytetrahydrobiopterin dehydratase [Vampirovibrionales bacterium]